MATHGSFFHKVKNNREMYAHMIMCQLCASDVFCIFCRFGAGPKSGITGKCVADVKNSYGWRRNMKEVHGKREIIHLLEYILQLV